MAIYCCFYQMWDSLLLKLESFTRFPIFVFLQHLLVAVHQNHNKPQLQNHNQHVHHYLRDHRCELWVGCRKTNNVAIWFEIHLSCASWLTYSHHAEFNLLLHSDLFIIRKQVKGAVNGAAVRPPVAVRDIVNVNGCCLHIAVWCATPLYTITEVFVEDISGGMVIVENLNQRRPKTCMVYEFFLHSKNMNTFGLNFHLRSKNALLVLLLTLMYSQAKTPPLQVVCNASLPWLWQTPPPYVCRRCSRVGILLPPQLHSWSPPLRSHSCTERLCRGNRGLATNLDNRTRCARNATQ